MPLRALIFDVDGTLAETEEWHRTAFNAAFAASKLPWRWDADLYRDLLTVTGGKERMLHFARRHDPARLAEVEPRLAALHQAKNARYAELVASSRGGLRPGVRRLIEEARARGLKLAVATTTSRPNLEALIASAFGPESASLFAALVCGEDVSRKKPDPEVYRIALQRLDAPARESVAIEDSRNGLLAARAAGIATLVTPSLYTAHEDFDGAALLAADLDHGPDGAPVTLGVIEAALAALGGADQ